MSGQDRARVIAEQIVNEDVRDELGGYVYWIDNHSCGTYGCCGGGREIDKPALTRLIAQALTEAEARGRAAALAVPPVLTAGWQPPEVPKPTKRDPTIEPWLLSKGFVWDEGKLCVAWSHRSGFDRTSLMFWPHDYGWDAVIGCHASGENPRLGMGTCYTLAEVQMVCETVRCINGYPQREGYPSEWVPSPPQDLT
jgi:hypothetical protein